MGGRDPTTEPLYYLGQGTHMQEAESEAQPGLKPGTHILPNTSPLQSSCKLAHISKEAEKITPPRFSATATEIAVSSSACFLTYLYLKILDLKWLIFKAI